ncbi:MAG: cell envelope integrity protein TolA [Steroidobacteraceae bacterium]
MSAALRPTLAPFSWALALHMAIAGLLLVGLVLLRQESPLEVLPIEAVIFDQAVLQAAASLRLEEERRLEREATLRREEQARVARIEADEQRAREEEAAAARRKAEAEAKLKAEQEARAKAVAEQKRRAQEARQKADRAERESELRARMAEEEERTSAAFQSLKARYVAALQAHVERRWFKPPGSPVGASCVAFVTQIPGGEVVAVRFGSCGGGEAFRQSVENAIRNASPLPAPPQPSLFEREVRLVFKSE